MNSITHEDHMRIRTEACEKAAAMKVASPKLPREDALTFMRSPRGQFVMARALSLAIAGQDYLPRHRRMPSDMKDVATLLWSLYPGIAEMEMQQVLEQAGIDSLLEAQHL
jgi:hypothetical protein